MDARTAFGQLARALAQPSYARGTTADGLLERLRRTWLQRLLVGLIWVTFVPVLSASVACQVHCVAGDAAPRAMEMPEPIGMPAAGEQTPAAWPALDYLSHGGPCHLMAIPTAAATALQPVAQGAAADWRPTVPERYDSFLFPPPEHRPRG